MAGSVSEDSTRTFHPRVFYRGSEETRRITLLHTVPIIPVILLMNPIRLSHITRPLGPRPGETQFMLKPA